MCTFVDIERIFNNQSVGAFVGALAAFFLVMFTDWRRNRRRARNLLLEVENSKFHADRKRKTVIENRDDMRTRNALTPARYIRFNSGLIRQLAAEVINQLSPEERRAIDAICFRMEG